MKKPLRRFGLLLVAFQAIAFVVLAAERATPEELISGRILLSPPTIGIAIAGLWSFPQVWNRIPSLLQKLLLLVLGL